MPQVHYVKKARKARRKEHIKRGESYYWWRTRRVSGKVYVTTKHFSKSRPKPSQLTSSPFLKEVYLIQEEIELDDVDYVSDSVTGWTSQIQDLMDELRSSFDSMPVNFQEAATGQLMEERIGLLNEWIENLEDIANKFGDDDVEVFQELIEANPGF